MRFRAWQASTSLWMWLATHGPRRANGDRLTVPLARAVYLLSDLLWKAEWSPDW